ISLSILTLLLLTGLVDINEGLSGFSSHATVTIAAMFVLSSGLQKTGAVKLIGRGLLKFGNQISLLTLVLCLGVGTISAFVNNTAAVAVLLPVVLTVCSKKNIAPSKLLIPLSYASQFGGVCTLIGTSTNLLVSSISADAGYGAFSMFELSKLGLIMLIAGTLYLVTIGQSILPNRKALSFVDAYELREYVTEIQVHDQSPLIGKTLRESNFRQKYEAAVLEIIRNKEKIWGALDIPIEPNDVLIVRGSLPSLMRLKDSVGFDILAEFKLQDEDLKDDVITMVEVLLSATSTLIGKTLADIGFQQRYNCIVIAVRRKEELIREKLSDIELRFGDELLLQGPKLSLQSLRNNENFIVLQEIGKQLTRNKKAPIAIFILITVVILSACGILPILHAALMGSLMMIFTRCITMEEAHAAINWQVIFLLAGVLPLGIALTKTGTAQFIVDSTIDLLGNQGPYITLAAIYLITAFLTEIISNNATAVLMAPIAISTAIGLGISPKPLLIAVCFAASTSFSTPVGYQTNTMVYNPAGYKFSDFIKAGVPLNIIFCILAVIFIPVFWSF
ncbi:MAG: SLC13 family permease, partial [Bdellovibrionales bacterium]|nr:SLC13 family permease [Bdellovibrionales bacterium]